MNRLALILFCLLFTTDKNLCAQNNYIIPKQYCKSKVVFYKGYSFNDHLIEENQYYVFKIKRIVKMRDGYLFRAVGRINNHKISALIVSPFGDNCVISKKDNLVRVNHKYSISLQRYFQTAANSIGSESGFVVDVLLGEKTISINESGFYNYLFTSMNLSGLSVKYRSEVDTIVYKYDTDSVAIKSTIESFIRHICFDEAIGDLIDTFGMKRAFSRYGVNIWARSPDDLIRGHYNRRNWYIDSIPQVINWTVPPYCIDTCHFESFFQYILNRYYNFPIIDTLPNHDIIIIGVSLLFHEPTQNIYTIRVGWEIPSLNKEFTIIVNIRKIKDKFKICGLNKPYHSML